MIARSQSCSLAHRPGHGAVRDEVRVDGLRVVEVDHAAALCLGEHSHDVAKICVVLGGGVSERRGLDVLSPGAFEPVLRPAGATHANQYHACGARSLLVEIDPRDARVRTSTEGLAADRTTARALSARLYAAFRAPRSSRARLVAGAARALLDAFEADRRAELPAWLEAAREALATELSAPPPLADLAARLGVHPVYLAQAFRAHYGVTTRAFVRAHRVFRAMQLVLDGTPARRSRERRGVHRPEPHDPRGPQRARRAAGPPPSRSGTLVAYKTEGLRCACMTA